MGYNPQVLKKMDPTEETEHTHMFLYILLVYIDLDYCDIEWFALETNRDHFVVFEIAPKYFIQTLLLNMMAT